jgi:crossover junction endodeoxyribonuclease RusA
MAQGLRRINADALHVTITLCPPNNNRRDVQNTIAALKAAVDGVADVLGVDDSRWRIVWPVAFSGPVRGGCVLVEIAADQMVTA